MPDKDMPDVLEAADLPNAEPIKGKTYIADGWVYRDIPWMTEEYFDKFEALLGEDIVWLVQSLRGNQTRGQALISPAGLEKIRTKYAEEAEKS